MIKGRKSIARAIATVMFLSTFTNAASALEPRATVNSALLAGQNRAETAVKVSESFGAATHAIIINGDKGLVDALTATPYASLKKAPILISEKDKLAKETKERLTKLGVKTVDIVGGEAVVSKAVEDELKAMKITVNRIFGKDRYGTALAVADEIHKISPVTKIAVVNGATGLADAVSIAAPAADNNMPILLADPNTGMEDSKTFMTGKNITKSYVVGQTTAVSNPVMNSLPGTKTRLGGDDRHDTNAKVIKEFYKDMKLDNIYVAKSGYVKNNEELVDALTVGVLAAKTDDPVLIVEKSLGTSQKALLNEKQFEKITQVGNGIPTASIDEIKATQSSTKEVKTVAELKTALSVARSGDVINFKPSSTISTAVDISSDIDVTVNLYNTYSSDVNVDLEDGKVNVYGTISGKLSVTDAEKVSVQSGAKVTGLDIKSTAKDLSVENKGTVTTLDVAATGVEITNSGTVTTLNKLSDTTVDGNGTIGNMPVDTTKPVSQIIVENGKQITVRFSQAIDALPSTVNITGFGEGTSPITSGKLTKELSKDKKTMTITSKLDEKFEGNYDLVIDGIYSNGTKLDRYTTTFKAEKDEKSPQVTDVAFNQDTNKIEITLSEPIDSIDDAVLRLNDVSKENSIDAITKPTNKITISRPADVELGKSVKIYLAGIKDKSGNTIESYEKSLTLTKVELTISEVKQVATNKIRLTFNKKLPVGQTITASEIKIYKSGDKDKKQLVTAVSALKSDGKSFDITVNDDNIFTGTTVSQSVQVVLSENACTDNTWVKNKSITKSLTLTKDTTKPTVKSTVLNTAKDGLEITLSEDITIVDSSVIKLKKNGVNLDTTVELKANTNNVIVVKTTNSSFLDEDGKLKAGSYRVYIPSGAVKDLSGNGIAAVNTSEIEIVGTVASKDAMNLIINQNHAYANEFTVTTTGSSVTVGKDDVFKYSSELYKSFSIDGKTIPSNSNVRFEDHTYTTIIVTLPDDYVKSTGKAQLKVSGLKVKSGRAVNSKTQTINVIDNVNPTLEKVELVTVKDKKNTKNIKEYRMKLTFDESIMLKEAGSTLEKLLSSVKMISGKTEFNGKGKNLPCTYKKDGKQVIITLTPSQVSSSNWTTVVSNSSTTVFEVTKNINIITDTNTDTDTASGRTPLPVRKGTKLNIVKSSISE